MVAVSFVKQCIFVSVVERLRSDCKSSYEPVEYLFGIRIGRTSIGGKFSWLIGLVGSWPTVLVGAL